MNAKQIRTTMNKSQDALVVNHAAKAAARARTGKGESRMIDVALMGCVGIRKNLIRIDACRELCAIRDTCKNGVVAAFAGLQYKMLKND